MAEVLGVVASGISVGSLAVQIVGSIQQILDFWSSIKDAPENVQFLLEELDILGNLLSEIDEDEQAPAIRNAINKAARYCKIARANIDNVLHDLTQGFASTKGRRHWTAIKAAMNEKKLARSLSRLERGKTVLNLAYQCYNQAKSKAFQDFQRQKFQVIEDILSTSNQQLTGTSVTNQGNTASSPSERSNSMMITTRKATCHLGNETSYWLIMGTLSIRSNSPSANHREIDQESPQFKKYSFYPATWASIRGFEVLSTRIYGLWQYSFRSYRIITRDDPIYTACKFGDMELVHKMCSQGEATPYDTTSEGWSLLHVAATHARPLLCRWLIGQGVDGNVANSTLAEWLWPYTVGTTPLAAATLSLGLNRSDVETYAGEARVIAEASGSDRPSDVLSTLRVLIEEGGSDPMAADDEGRTAIHRHTGSSEQFSYLLNQEQFHIDIRQQTDSGETVAEYHASCAWSESPSLARVAWEREVQQLGLSKSSPINLLHGAASSLGHFEDNGISSSSLLTCLQFVKMLVVSGVDVHGKSHGGVTPLARIPQQWMGNALLVQLLRQWTDNLQEANVDVRNYLREEERLALERKENGDWLSDWLYDSEEFRVEWQFYYGENVGDCFVSATYEFRQKETEKHSPVPGAWIEDG